MIWLKCFLHGHLWVHQHDSSVFEHSGASRPLYVKRVYQCSRCLKAKKVKL